MATKRKRTDQPKKKDEASAARTGTTGRRPVARKRRWPLVVALVLVAIIVAVVGTFSWDRWLRYDDAAEFQGEWQAHGTPAVVVIDGERINLTDDVSYAYAIDPVAKTLSFTFGSLEGQGRYRFSLDRTQLVITEGDGYSWLLTLVDDIAWMWDQAARAVQGQPQEEPAQAEGVTVLDRLSHDSAAAPRADAAVAEPEPEPAAAPEAEAESQPEAEGAPAPAAPEPEPSDDSDDSASANPLGAFDVSDHPA
ncbi:hypothetical protein [Arabiibacter massiliensis]|uniref:hypothetical protein n=1 Tax=Arabiibacter massiliensis TaxID=1870985 RepID=UPI0009B98941|nr:hypothetical protein [Arabiibacter massiliensis]